MCAHLMVFECMLSLECYKCYRMLYMHGKLQYVLTFSFLLSQTHFSSNKKAFVADDLSLRNCDCCQSDCLQTILQIQQSRKSNYLHEIHCRPAGGDWYWRGPGGHSGILHAVHRHGLHEEVTVMIYD